MQRTKECGSAWGRDPGAPRVGTCEGPQAILPHASAPPCGLATGAWCVTPTPDTAPHTRCTSCRASPTARRPCTTATRPPSYTSTTRPAPPAMPSVNQCPAVRHQVPVPPATRPSAPSHSPVLPAHTHAPPCPPVCTAASPPGESSARAWPAGRPPPAPPPCRRWAPRGGARGGLPCAPGRRPAAHRGLQREGEGKQLRKITE